MITIQFKPTPRMQSKHLHLIPLTQTLVVLMCLLVRPICLHPFGSESMGRLESELFDDLSSSESSFHDMSHEAGSTLTSSARHQHYQHQNYLNNHHLQSRYLQQQQQLQHQAPISEDYYEYRHIFAAAVGRALDECRQKFKWDRWNCPKKAFLSILDRDEANGANGGSLLPTNKELGLTRALIASSTVLSVIKSCSYGSNRMCNCSSSNGGSAISISSNDNNLVDLTTSPYHLYEEHHLQQAKSHHLQQQQQQQQQQMNSQFNNRSRRHAIQDQATAASSPLGLPSSPAIAPIISHGSSKFVWTGCEETVKFGFKISRRYLDQQDEHHQLDEASRLINEHNYRAGRLAVRRVMRRKCKCHGVSGTCQLRTCWTIVPSIAEIGDHLKRQYQMAAKVGASSTNETDPVSLSKELASINPEKLVFADPSPDYCYENKRLGVNGTLERYCSRSKVRDGLETSRSERNSCDRLCTKCGYKIEKVELRVERQCECRFVYCCSVECKRCPAVEEAYKCVRHS